MVLPQFIVFSSYEIGEIIDIYFQNSCQFVGTMYLIASVNTAFIIPAVLLIIKLYFIRRYYMNTGRDIKRLESACKSGIQIQ